MLGSREDASPARAIELSGHGLRLLVSHPVPVSAPIKIQCGDEWLALGETCYCLAEGSHFTVGVQVDQILTGLAELGDRRRELAAANDRSGS